MHRHVNPNWRTVVMQDFLHKAKSQELWSKQNKKNVNTPSRVIYNTSIFYTGWSQIRDSQLRSGRTRTLGSRREWRKPWVSWRTQDYVTELPLEKPRDKEPSLHNFWNRRGGAFLMGSRWANRKAIKRCPFTTAEGLLAGGGDTLKLALYQHTRPLFIVQSQLWTLNQFATMV